jgi:hypothetical protein
MLGGSRSSHVERRMLLNERALSALRADVLEAFPACVMLHAERQRWVPRTLRAAVDSYWRAHPIRADRLARALADKHGAPPGWVWRLDGEEGGRPRTFRLPPAPYREAAHARGPSHCCVCGGPVFGFGWHTDPIGDGSLNGRARWHACCVVAWRLWRAPRAFLRQLGARQGRRCAETGRRLLRTAEVDHATPLFLVWRDHRDLPWPELLRFWGVPNLRVIGRESHAEKSAREIRKGTAS